MRVCNKCVRERERERKRDPESKQEQQERERERGREWESVGVSILPIAKVRGAKLYGRTSKTKNSLR